MRSLYLLILFFAISSFPLFGQQRISGRIIHAHTGKAIEYANIFLKSDQRRGVLSNQEGRFALRLSEKDKTDTLVVSQLTFKSVFIPINKIKDTITIRLTENTFLLNEVTVIHEDGLKDILKRAINKIPINYGKKKFLAKAYYQEYSISDSAYSEIIECFVNIEDKSYKTPKTKSKIRLEELRKSDDRRNLPSRINLDGISQLFNTYERKNSVRSRQLHFLAVRPEHFFQHYDFFNYGEYYSGRDTLIRIGFRFNPNGLSENMKGMSIFLGEILINKTDLAILSVKSGNPDDGSFREVTYKKVKGKYYPDKIAGAYQFKYDQKTHSYYNFSQLYIYDIVPKKGNNKGKKISREKSLRQLPYRYNEAFWQNNEILIRAPAPKALESDLNKYDDLIDQYKMNEKKQKKGGGGAEPAGIIVDEGK